MALSAQVEELKKALCNSNNNSNNDFPSLDSRRSKRKKTTSFAVETANSFEVLEEEEVMEAEAVKPVEEVPQRKCKIPPIVIRDSKLSWCKLNEQLKNKNVNIEKARSVSLGVQIHPETSTDYRSAVKYLAENKIEHHTWQLPEDKKLQIVIKGVVCSITPEEICRDLENKGFHPESVTRMNYRGDRKNPMQMVLVTLPKSEKEAYQIKELCKLIVHVESKKKSAAVSQYYRCQKFGHSQRLCKAEARCVKCAGRHHTLECTKMKDKNTPAKCVNCGGDHTASFRGCTKWPKMGNNKIISHKKPEVRPGAPEIDNRVVQGVSYASKAKQFEKVNLSTAFQQVQQTLSRLIQIYGAPL